MLIPVWFVRSRSTALGLCGATNGLYVAGITALRRRRDCSGGYRTWLYPQPAGPPLNGVLLGLIPLWWY